MRTTLQVGDRGADVFGLQQQLLALGYWLPGADGDFGDGTMHAVVALQKTAGIERDGVVGAMTRRALADGVRPQPQTASGHAVEIDKSRQILLVADGGRTSWTFDTSTGSGSTYLFKGRTYLAVTPAGSFHVTWVVNGVRVSPLGVLYRPRFLGGGIAIHGYSFVPPYPASHGCIRVTNGAIDFIWVAGLAPIGSSVLVY